MRLRTLITLASLAALLGLVIASSAGATGTLKPPKPSTWVTSQPVYFPPAPVSAPGPAAAPGNESVMALMLATLLQRAGSSCSASPSPQLASDPNFLSLMAYLIGTGRIPTNG
jgi:hypothetical protein